MQFQPLYFEKELMQINPNGDVGILTLWSKPDWVLQKLQEKNVDLSPQTSRIVAIGTLYGNGLPELLRNLLHNPQIQHLMIGGRDRSDSKKELFHFFQKGVIEADCLGTVVHRILDTSRHIDILLKPELFQFPPTLYDLGDFTDEVFFEPFQKLPLKEEKERTRLVVPLPKIEVQTKPSNLRAHTILKQKPLEAWKELVFRAVNFGRDVTLKKGKRRELQNVKVLVEEPLPDSEADLRAQGFDPEYLKRYQEEFVSGVLPLDTEYTYGNRLQKHYGFSTLERCGELLKKDRECRTAYISLWDTALDLRGESHPCLVSVFFRAEGNVLNITGSFRTHNIMDAWLPNVYGLMRVLQDVSKRCEMSPGVLTTFSHSISIDHRKLEQAQRVGQTKKNQIELDPAGDFKVNVEEKEIVVRHLYQGLLIKEYRSVKAQALQHQLSRDHVVFDLNHALYLGRQIANAEWCIKTGTTFQED